MVVARAAEPVVGKWRLRYLRESVERGNPPRLTVLFPFVSGEEIDDEVLAALRRLYSPMRPLVHQLASVEAFPDPASLAPRRDEPFLELVARTRAAFPSYAAYRDREHVPVPRCTGGVDDDHERIEAMLRELPEHLRPSLPIHCRAAGVAPAGERAGGTSITRGPFPLEGSP